MPIIEEIEKWKGEYLSPFCLNDCKTICCALYRTVLMTEEQVREIYEIPEDEKIPLNENIIGAVGGQDGKFTYSVFIYQDDEPHYCKGYDITTKLCKIQHNKPEGCKNYPISIEDDNVILEFMCGVGLTDNVALDKLKEIVRIEGYHLTIDDQLFF